MPGARWFEGAQVNYARQVFRHVDAAHAAGFPAVISRNEKGEHRELSWPELRRQVAVAGAAPAGTGRAARRPRGGLPAERPGGDRRLPGGGEHRRRLEHLRARHGHQRRAGPLQADRAQGADRLRRRHYGGRDFDRTGVVAELRAALPTRAAPARASQSRCGRAALQTLAPWHRHGAGHGPRRRCRAGVRAAVAAVRPSAVDRLFQRHHRPAQAHRPRPWRHRDRGTRAEGAAQRRRLQLPAQHLGRALPLVQLHRLGDVERADQRPAQRHDLLHLRRQPGRHQGQAGLDGAVALRRRPGRDLLRRRRGVLRQLHEGGRRLSRLRRLRTCARWAPPARR